ncbi:MAG TPA: twin-arginine translocation signal domain-containing protein, partial [Verrucomicrobiota bacterium]|nr:twin-arginine translocation signal domain-containing protein [Verrucomicrobiota bacterium]
APPSPPFFLAFACGPVFNSRMNTVPVGCGARRALNRRDFVCLAGLAAAGAALFPGGQEGNAAEVDKPKETLVGSNIYGWTQ